VLRAGGVGGSPAGFALWLSGDWRWGGVDPVGDSACEALALRFGCQHVVWETQRDVACGVQTCHLLSAQCYVRCAQVFR
jgi:hypothetical protein